MKDGLETFKDTNTGNVLSEFDLVYQMIRSAHNRIYQQANTTMISLYWSVGQYISTKISGGYWGRNAIEGLSAYIYERHPSVKGFSVRNIRRMRLFYETYGADETQLALL